MRGLGGIAGIGAGQFELGRPEGSSLADENAVNLRAEFSGLTITFGKPPTGLMRESTRARWPNESISSNPTSAWPTLTKLFGSSTGSLPRRIE